MRSRPDGCHRRFQLLIRTEAELDYHRVGESHRPAGTGCMNRRQRTLGLRGRKRGWGVSGFCRTNGAESRAGFMPQMSPSCSCAEPCAGSHKRSFYVNVPSSGKMFKEHRLWMHHQCILAVFVDTEDFVMYLDDKQLWKQIMRNDHVVVWLIPAWLFITFVSKGGKICARNESQVANNVCLRRLTNALSTSGGVCYSRREAHLNDVIFWYLI